MPLVPDNVDAKIRFYQTRLDTWELNAEEIGLSASDVELLRAKVDAAREALDARNLAMGQAQAATLAMHLAVDAMHALGAADILRVRAKAAQTGDDGVYSKASLPLPKKASPIGEPTKPGRFEVELKQGGELALTWKCRTPGDSGGTVYEVRRRLGGLMGPSEFLGLTTIKQFVDTTIPRGTSSITYEVTPIRGAGGVARDRTRRGPTGCTNVNFGTMDSAAGVGRTSTVAKVAA